MVELVARAKNLVSRGERRILGITGPPGSGKSTLASAIVAELGHDAIAVPMDGYHLTNQELKRLGRRDRKGAPSTFDPAGYVALLARLKAQSDNVVYAPEFRRELEEAVAGAIAIPRQIPLVVTEGNYLLLDRSPWSAIRTLIDEVWYLETDDLDRIERLIDRHIRFGKSPDDARAWVTRSDEANTRAITPTSRRADVIVAGDVLR